MKKYLLAPVLLALCLCLLSCSKKPAVFRIRNAEFTKTQMVLSEGADPIGGAYSLNKNLEVTQWKGVTYAFEPGIAPTDREACIQATDAVLTRIGLEKSLQISIYTNATYNETFIRDSAVYTCLQDWKSPEYIAALLQGLFGEYCNYGGAYGYAGYLRSEVFDLPANVCDADWTFTGDPEILDLNALCLNTQFFSGVDVKAAKRLANTFAADYIEENGEEAFRKLLIQSGTVEEVGVFADALSDFYGSRSIKWAPTELLFRLGGKGYDYIIKCKYAVMYMESDWVDRNTGKVPMLYDGFLHKNYSDIKQHFLTTIQEMGQYQDLFALDSYDNDLNIYFTNHYRNNYDAYLPSTHSIAIAYAHTLSVFYIDSLTHHCIMQEDWAYLGSISYFSNYYNHYGTTEMNYVANMESDYENLRFYREYRAYLGRDIDLSTDHEDFAHFCAHAKGYRDPNRGGSDSFVAYLVSRFGEETVIDILCRTHDFGEYTYEDLVTDWNAFLKDRYPEIA